MLSDRSFPGPLCRDCKWLPLVVAAPCSIGNWFQWDSVTGPSPAASFQGLKESCGVGEALKHLFSLVDLFVEHSYGPGAEPDPENTDIFPAFMAKGRQQKPRRSCRLFQLQLTADPTKTGLCFKRELIDSLN